MGTTNALNVEVYGHPVGRFLVKSKFNRKGITRSLKDLDWALKAFQVDNPHFGIIGQNAESYFKSGDSIEFFKHKKIISKLMSFAIRNSSKSEVRSSLTNLREMLSFNTKDDQSFFRTSSIKTTNSKLIDDFSLCESGEVPHKR